MRSLAFMLLAACGVTAPTPAHAEDSQTCDVTVEAPEVTVEAPQVTVQAPDVTVNPVIEVASAPAPQVTVNPSITLGQVVTVNITQNPGGSPQTPAGSPSIQWQTWVFNAGGHRGVEYCATLTATITNVSDRSTWEEDMTGCCPPGYDPVALGPIEQGSRTHALVCQS